VEEGKEKTMGPIYAYNNGYRNPIQSLLMTPASDTNQAKSEYLEPQEVFDILLRKECEKNARKISPPQHTQSRQAEFNQYSFNRAGSTLALMKSLEQSSRPSVVTESLQAQEGASLQNEVSPTTSVTASPQAAMDTPSALPSSPLSSNTATSLRSLQDQVALGDSEEEENDPSPVNEKV
jgi:hypothetical protein